MQTKKYLDKIIGQSNLLGTWWGNLQTIAQHTNIYIQFMILCFSGTSAYAVLSTALHEWGYQLAFWQFALGVVALLVIMCLFVWRLSIPSTFATWNEQFWKNKNLLRERMAERDKEVDAKFEEIKKLIKENNENKRVS